MRRLLLAALVLACPVASAVASRPEPKPREYRLKLFSPNSGERLDVVYRRDDAYDSEALAKLDRFLRDLRAGSVKSHDPRLFDLLTDLMLKMKKPEGELHVICGYRTPETNSRLRRKSSKVAKASLHMQAEAIDIRVPGVRTARLRDAAVSLARGGVGYYAKSDFVHVDVGPVRRW